MINNLNDDDNTNWSIIVLPLEISIIAKVESYYACISSNVLSSLLHLGRARDPHSYREWVSPKWTRMKVAFSGCAFGAVESGHQFYPM